VETPWGRLPPELAPALRARLDRTVGEVTRQVTTAGAAFAEVAGPKVARDVEEAVRVAVERFLELVGTDEEALSPAVRDAYVAIGAAEARDDRTPEVQLTALRTASRLLVRAAADALAEIRPVHTSEVLDLSDAVTAFADELAAASTEGYALQVREQAGEGDRRRRALGDLLVRGGTSEAAASYAATAVGWRGLGDIVPVLLPPEQSRDARFRYAADGVVLDRERDVLLLLQASSTRARRERLSEGLRGRAAVVGPRVAWTGVPIAVRLAEMTAQIIDPDPGDPPVFVDDHLVALALRGEPGALDVLAAHRLAPLGTLPDSTRERLLATLACWLRHWGSRPDVAAEMFVHPQTVSYRMRQLHALLGDTLDDPRARLELLLVIQARRLPLAVQRDPR